MHYISPEAALDPLLQQSLPKAPVLGNHSSTFWRCKPFFVQPASLCCKCLTGSLVPMALAAHFPVLSHLRGASQYSSLAPVSISRRGFCNFIPRLTHRSFSRPRLQATVLSSRAAARAEPPGGQHAVTWLSRRSAATAPNRESHHSAVSHNYH